MKKQTKPFTPYPTRPIRMSDKTWDRFKKNKLRTGLSWDRFIDKANELLEAGRKQSLGSKN